MGITAVIKPRTPEEEFRAVLFKMLQECETEGSAILDLLMYPLTEEAVQKMKEAAIRGRAKLSAFEKVLAEFSQKTP